MEKLVWNSDITTKRAANVQVSCEKQALKGQDYA
jgi:hypothetical protein